MNNLLSLRVAIVGCGCLGTRYASLLGDARLVVACDKDPRRAACLAATAHACFATNQLTEALSFLPDAVIVATPPHLGPLIASESLRAGSHVFLPCQEVAPPELFPVYALAEQTRKVVRVEMHHGESSLAQFLDIVRAAHS
jgi:hypothetical protein